jgi:hypothetical protein
VQRSSFIALFSLLATVAVAAQESTATNSAPTTVSAAAGKMLLASNGTHLGLVYRVSPDGSAQLIIDGRLVTVPVTTLSTVDGKLKTSLTRSEVLALH